MPAQEAQDLLQAIDAFGRAYQGDPKFAQVLDALGQVAQEVDQLEGGEPAGGEPGGEPAAESQPKSYPAAEKAAKHRMRQARVPIPPK